MIRAGVGISEGEDAYIVGLHAAENALAEAGGSAQALFVFASSTYNHERIHAGIRSITDATIIGSSTAGEFTTLGHSTRPSVVAMAISSDTLSFSTHAAYDIQNSVDIVKDLTTARAGKKKRPSVFIFFADILHKDGDGILQNVVHAFSSSHLFFGGASADNFEFKCTSQYGNEKVHTDAIVGLGIMGKCAVGIGVQHGFVPVGAPKTITKAANNIISELDNIPAVEIYREYFGDNESDAFKTNLFARLALTYPLGEYRTGNKEHVVRNPLGTDTNGGIVLTAGIREGTEVQLMIGSHTEAIEAAENATRSALEGLKGAKPKAAIICESAGRGKMLGEYADVEIRAIRKIIGEDTPIAGCYTYGEFASAHDTKIPEFYNATFSIMLIGE